MRVPKGRATETIAVATAVVWVALELAGWNDWAAILGGFIPARVTGDVIVPDAVPWFLTPLRAAMLHAGIAHLGFNMMMLVFCGRSTEPVLGSGALIALYGIGAYAAAFAQYLVDPGSTVPMVGASGALSAVVGAYAMLFGQRRARALGPIPARVVHIAWLAAAWIGVQLLFGVAMMQAGMAIAVAAHIGGFIAGLLMARPLLLWRYRRA